uniref:Uncharacterized protein n=1 Tax=Dasya binghamiae TaxID=1896963 RepID=A0A1C8XRX6_9FLOR|nr:hypothetical protein BI108_pgp172 [Dasya binghamiae]AOH77235.1 hypothetical protein [Dasya binghamiae]
MIKYWFLVCCFINPFKIIESSPSIRHRSPVSVVAMAPQGGHLSREATNKVNPPGCSVNKSETNKTDGSVEIRETLTCTTITTISPSDKVTTKPSSGSKQDKRDQEKINEYSKKRK